MKRIQRAWSILLLVLMAPGALSVETMAALVRGAGEACESGACACCCGAERPSEIEHSSACCRGCASERTGLPDDARLDSPDDRSESSPGSPSSNPQDDGEERSDSAPSSRGGCDCPCCVMTTPGTAQIADSPVLPQHLSDCGRGARDLSQEAAGHFSPLVRPPA